MELRDYMDNVRAVLIFFVILLVCGLLLLSFNQRGYEKVERINQYVLYQREVEECIDQEYEGTLLICENKYILRSGLTESNIVMGLDEGLVTMEEIKDYIEYEIIVD